MAMSPPETGPLQVNDSAADPGLSGGAAVSEWFVRGFDSELGIEPIKFALNLLESFLG